MKTQSQTKLISNMNPYVCRLIKASDSEKINSTSLIRNPLTLKMLLERN